MAVGFAPEIDIWEVELRGMPIARFVDEESADEYIRQVKKEAETNHWIKPDADTLRKYPTSVVRFVGIS